MANNVFEKSKVFKLKEAVSYSEGAIVSKIVERNDSGNITLFAFDKEQNLSEHTAPFDALVQIIEGKAKIIIDGVTHSMEEGELIIMPAGIRHAVEAVSRFKMMLIMIKAKTPVISIEKKG
jgi:quercetin dioxygenase-like cupin family protein